MKKIVRRLILVEYGNGTRDVHTVYTKRDLDKWEKLLRQDPQVEFYEVVKAEYISCWSNPDCCSEG